MENSFKIEQFTDLEKVIIIEEEALALQSESLKKRDDDIITKKVELRKKTINEQYALFIASKDVDTQNFVYLNPTLLNSAITSYYLDIHRLKRFSGSLWANANKQAAYTIKWLVRFRPIQIKETTKHVSEEIYDINLKFALACGFAFLSTEVKKIILNDKINTDSQNKTKSNDEEKEYSFYDKLLYDLRYRQLSGKKLTLVFEALELAAK